jgi:Ribulose-phosphate 3 epimerase family
MDGDFVPNLSMGPAIVGSLRKVTRLPLETHLMVSDADLFLDAFASAGSDSLLVHWSFEPGQRAGGRFGDLRGPRRCDRRDGSPAGGYVHPEDEREPAESSR